MNEILSVSLVLLAALLAGHAAQVLRIPEVTGYLMVGLLIGPGAFDVLSHDNLEALRFLSEVALGLILFSIGSIFEAGQFRRVGSGVLRIALWETSTTFALVLGGGLLVGQPVTLALLLAVIAMETAPATTLMVLHEYDARGPMTDRVHALLALNNMVVLVAFAVVMSGLTLARVSAADLSHAAYAAAHGLVWSTVGSIALGVLLGLGLQAWLARIRESGEVLILAMGCVLLAVGAARALDLSPLFASLALGATVANTSTRGHELLAGLGRADPPLYAAFFVLAGAELQPATLPALGMAGVLYVALRAAGKLAGVRLATRGADLGPAVRRHLGLCLLASSSLAVGLTLEVRHQFPDLATRISGVVLAAVLVFEVVGPLLTRHALLRTGEAQTVPDPLAEPASPSEPIP